MAASNRFRVLLVIIIAIIIGATGFTLGYYWGRRETPASPTPVRIGHLVADIHQIGFFVSFDKGYWEGQGIAPKRFEYLYGMPEMMAFSAGELDAGYVGCVPALIAKAKGADLVILASANLEGSAIVAKHEIGSIEELDGKRVGYPGLGSIQSCMIRMVADKLGITMEYKDYSISDLPLALERGEIDAFIAWEPFCAEAVVKGLGHIIYTSRDILPNHQCCVFYVSGKLLRENRELAKKLLIGHVRAMKFATEHPEDSMKIFVRMTGKSEDVVRECWGRMVFDYHLNVESLKVFLSYLVSYGFIEGGAVQDVDLFLKELVDTSLLEEVEREV